MAKSGSPSRSDAHKGERSTSTRRALVAAAIETLKEEGFSRTSARSIAERAEMNQGLISYHFGSVVNLLLAALDAVSEDRMSRFRVAVDQVTSPIELVDVATRIFHEDLDSGHTRVLVEMIAGASSTPGLGEEVAVRIGPWFTFTQDAVDATLASSPVASLVASRDIAYVLVALFLGVEMLTHLDGDRQRAERPLLPRSPARHSRGGDRLVLPPGSP